MDLQFESTADAALARQRAQHLRGSAALSEASPAPMEERGQPEERAQRLRDIFALFPPSDLATLLDVDERTLAVWRSQKRGPDYVKLGRSVFYHRKAVEAWIELNITPTDRAA